MSRGPLKRRWRDFRTSSGRSPVKDFLSGLDEEDLASVVAAMVEVRREGLSAARHLDGEIYEVRADGNRVTYRILFATEGRKGQVLLSLVAFTKKTRRTPPSVLALAKRRLGEWRGRKASIS